MVENKYVKIKNGKKEYIRKNKILDAYLNNIVKRQTGTLDINDTGIYQKDNQFSLDNILFKLDTPIEGLGKLGVNEIRNLGENENVGEMSITNNGDNSLSLEGTAESDEGVTVQGTSFTITDADTTKQAEITEIRGNTSQEGTPTPETPVEVETVTGDNNIVVSGKNLLNVTTGQTSNGITFAVNEDGTFNITGTASSTYSNHTSTSNRQSINLKKEKTYTFWINQAININFRIRLYNEEGTLIDTYIITSGTTSTTFTLNENATTFYLYSTGLVRDNNYNISNLGAMLYEGTEIVTTYEEYKGNTYRVDLGGKNLFNYQATPVVNWRTTIVSTTNNELVLKPTQNANGYLSFDIAVKPSTAYTVSIKDIIIENMGTWNGTFYLYEYNENNVQHFIANMNTNNLIRNFTTQADTVRLRLQPYSSGGSYDTWETGQITYKKIMLCEGTDTNYSPYTDNPIELTENDKIWNNNGTWQLNDTAITDNYLLEQLQALENIELYEDLCYVDWVGEPKGTMKLHYNYDTTYNYDLGVQSFTLENGSTYTIDTNGIQLVLLNGNTVVYSGTGGEITPSEDIEVTRAYIVIERGKYYNIRIGIKVMLASGLVTTDFDIHFVDVGGVNELQTNFTQEFSKDGVIATYRYTFNRETWFRRYADGTLIQLAQLNGRKITAIGFSNNWIGGGSFQSNRPVLAVLDTSQYDLRFNANETLDITRVDSISSDAKMYTSFNEVKGPIHLAPLGMPELKWSKTEDDLLWYYKEGIARLEAVYLTNYPTNEGTQELEMFDVYGDKTDDFSTNGNRIDFATITTTGDSMQLRPDNSLSPSSNLSPIASGYKYVLYKYKIYQPLLKLQTGYEETDFIDTGLTYYMAQEIPHSGNIDLEIKYERS